MAGVTDPFEDVRKVRGLCQGKTPFSPSVLDLLTLKAIHVTPFLSFLAL